MDLLALLFPSVCFLCGGPIAREEPNICSPCLLKLPRERNYHGYYNNTADRLMGLFEFSGAYAFLRFSKNSSAQKIIHRAKYKGDKVLAVQLGLWFASEVLIQVKQQFDTIVPVPMHPEKIKLRGYNQTDEMASGIARVTGYPVCDILQRTRKAVTQTSLNRWQRFENTAREFKLADPHLIRGARVLLVMG